MRKYIVPQSSTLTYLAGDHLGSTSLAVDASTGEVIETRYKPWGEVRYTTPSKTLPTRYTFTGQYSYVSDDATDLGAAGFGLMFYNARWYDPALGRFAQADSIVPGGVQGYDRYNYVGNQPTINTDPTGHCPENDPECINRLYATLPLPEPSCLEQPKQEAIDTVRAYVPPPPGDPVDTPEEQSYAAMGLGIQNRFGLDARGNPNTHDSFDGEGWGRITDEQMTTCPYGTAIISDGKVVGYGLCLNEDQNTPEGASWGMGRRIEQAYWKGCPGCTPTDIFLIAALAQNSGFFWDTTKALIKGQEGFAKQDPITGELDWDGYLKSRNWWHDRPIDKEMIQQAINIGWGMMKAGYPGFRGVNWEKVCKLAK